MKHTLPELPFAEDALEPVISSRTIEFHYGKHHKGYVDKLNKLIVGTEFEEMSLEDIIKSAKGPIFNNAAQVWNHTFFWNCLVPGSGGPSGLLSDAIQEAFGSTEEFFGKFHGAGTKLFGSGYVWLTSDKEGKLAIETTSNAKNPMTEDKTPILTIDVWEHAYYLDYQNDRARFLERLFPLLNWEFAAQNYLANKSRLAA